MVLVNLNTDTTGNELHMHAEVKVRGVDVGEVREISTNGDGAQTATRDATGHGAPDARPT